MSRVLCLRILGRCFRAPAVGAALFVLATASLPAGRARGQTQPPPATGTAPEKRSIKENIKNLGKEVSHPSTPGRIKSHEQEVEAKIQRTRDQQRQNHGQAKPGDMVDVVKKLDDPEPGVGDTKGTAAAGAKVKVDGKTSTTSTTTKTTTTTTTTKRPDGGPGAPAR